MLLYSKTISSYIKRLTSYTREILTNEMGINVRKSRFEFNNYYIPFRVVVFEKEGQLGFFDPNTYQIGINKNLMYLCKIPVIKNIIRHELGHFITFLTHSNECLGHDALYRATCRKYGWEEEVYRAKANIEIENSKIEGDIPSEKIISKIKKLLALANSTNEHESTLATIKANQLLMQHNLNEINEHISEEEETVCVKRAIKAKRNTAKYHAIYEILKTFFVYPVFNYGKKGFYLEVVGNRTNVELADYIANFLDNELEKLWSINKKNNPSLKGTGKKSSFMQGVATGYVEKIKKHQITISKTNDLIVLGQNLARQVKMVYPRLSHMRAGGGNFSQSSADIGKQIGRNLEINPAIKGKNQTRLLLGP